MIRLRSQRAARAEGAAQVRIAVALERVLKREIEVILRDCADASAKAYAASGAFKAYAVTYPYDARIASALRKQYTRAIIVSAARVEKQLTGKTMSSILERKVVSADDLLTEEQVSEIVRKYIKDHALANAESIGKTTRSRIQRAIEKGTSQDLSGADIASLIRSSTGGAIAASRSELIARTETHSAMAYGGNEAAIAAGVETKTWLSTSDARTRDDHITMDKQTVKINEPFTGPCAGMMFPGDPNGPADEVINCRCTLLYDYQGR